MSKIYTETYGHEGSVIVLIHGWAMHSGIWRPFAQQLAQQHRVICLDLPGHGLSESIEPYTLNEITDALFKAIPTSEAVSLLGWSLGATVALNMAVRFPTQITALIMLGGNAHFLETAEWAGVSDVILNEFANNVQHNCQDTLLRFLALQVSGLKNRKTIFNQLKQAIKACNPPSNTVLQHALTILRTTDLRVEFMQLNCPVSLIQGDRDSLIPVEVGQKMQVIRPETELMILPNAAHVPFLSHQSDVIDIINRFL